MQSGGRVGVGLVCTSLSAAPAAIRHRIPPATTATATTDAAFLFLPPAPRRCMVDRCRRVDRCTDSMQTCRALECAATTAAGPLGSMSERLWTTGLDCAPVCCTPLGSSGRSIPLAIFLAAGVSRTPISSRYWFLYTRSSPFIRSTPSLTHPPAHRPPDSFAPARRRRHVAFSRPLHGRHRCRHHRRSAAEERCVEGRTEKITDSECIPIARRHSDGRTVAGLRHCAPARCNSVHPRRPFASAILCGEQRKEVLPFAIVSCSDCSLRPFPSARC